MNIILRSYFKMYIKLCHFLFILLNTRIHNLDEIAMVIKHIKKIL